MDEANEIQFDLLYLKSLMQRRWISVLNLILSLIDYHTIKLQLKGNNFQVMQVALLK